MVQPADITPGHGRRTSPGRLLLLLGPALLLITVLFGGGLLLGLLQALGHPPMAGEQGLSLDIFRRVIGDADFPRSLGLTLYISMVSTLIAAVFSVILALALNRWAATSRTIHFLLQIPLTVPHLVIAIAMLLLLSPSGIFSRIGAAAGLVSSPAVFPLLVNDNLGVAILATYVWKEIPFITFMLLAVLKNIGSELDEAGATLNASPWQRFRHITLPLISPSLGAACLIVFAFTFGAFEVPYLLGRTYPLTLPVWAYKSYSDVDLLTRPEGIAIGLLIATAVIFAIALSHLLLRLGGKRGFGE